jgi:hypothetical protein
MREIERQRRLEGGSLMQSGNGYGQLDNMISP